MAIIRRGPKVLVIRRSRSVVAPLSYCFPGGGIEPGETEQAALVREVREELGVTIRPVRRVWHCVTAWKVELGWWLAEMDADAVPRANPAEVESFHWVTPAEMARLPGLLESNRVFLEIWDKGLGRGRRDEGLRSPLPPGEGEGEGGWVSAGVHKCRSARMSVP